jgi:hypothetical protein
LALVRVNGGSFGSPSPGALGPVEIVSSYLGHNLYNKVMIEWFHDNALTSNIRFDKDIPIKS